MKRVGFFTYKTRESRVSGRDRSGNTTGMRTPNPFGGSQTEELQRIARPERPGTIFKRALLLVGLKGHAKFPWFSLASICGS